MRAVRSFEDMYIGIKNIAAAKLKISCYKKCLCYCNMIQTTQKKLDHGADLLKTILMPFMDNLGSQNLFFLSPDPWDALL